MNATEPSGPHVFRNIGQAYLSYQADVGKGLQIDFGKFVTPLGFEVIKTKDDWNYSRSLLFSLAIPFYHMGVRATYNVNDKIALAGAVVNGWNNTVATIDKKTVLGQITVKPTSALSPPETRRLFEFMASLKRQGKTLIFISHFLDDVLQVTDRISVLKNSRRVATAGIRKAELPSSGREAPQMLSFKRMIGSPLPRGGSISTTSMVSQAGRHRRSRNSRSPANSNTKMASLRGSNTGMIIPTSRSF